MNSEKLPIRAFNSALLIGSDSVDSDAVERFACAIRENVELDPTILYLHASGALIILEGNNRAYAHGVAERGAPCVVVTNEEEFQQLKRMGIHIGNLKNYETLEDVVHALIMHLSRTRQDIYQRIFAT